MVEATIIAINESDDGGWIDAVAIVNVRVEIVTIMVIGVGGCIQN